MSRNSLKVLRRQLKSLNCTQAPGFKNVCIIKRTFKSGGAGGKGQKKKKKKKKGRREGLTLSRKNSYDTLNPNLCIKHFLLLVNGTDANYKLLRTLKRAFLVAQTVKRLPTMREDPGLIPGSGRSPGEGNGNPLQYSCLGNPVKRGD